jgi:hypothetical protein
MNVWHWDDIPPSLPPSAATGCGEAFVTSCAAAERVGFGVLQCDDCVGKHQMALKAAGCTAAEVQKFCAVSSVRGRRTLPGKPATEYNYGVEAMPSVVTRLDEIRAELAGPVRCCCCCVSRMVLLLLGSVTSTN